MSRRPTDDDYEEEASLQIDNASLTSELQRQHTREILDHSQTILSLTEAPPEDDDRTVSVARTASLLSDRREDSLKAGAGIMLDGDVDDKDKKNVNGFTKEQVPQPPPGLHRPEDDQDTHTVDPPDQPIEEQKPGAIRVTANAAAVDLTNDSYHTVDTYGTDGQRIVTRPRHAAGRASVETVATAVTREDLEAQVRNQLLQSAVTATRVESLEVEQPTAPESPRQTGPKNEHPKKRRQLLWMGIVVVVVVVIIAVVVGAVVGVMNSRSGGSSSSSADSDSTPMPTSASNTAPTQSPNVSSDAVRDALLDILTEYSPVPAGLRDDRSPGSRALDWMVDAKFWTPAQIRSNPDEIAQTFGLASIFVAPIGNEWNQGSDTWMQSPDVCGWYGVSCDSQSMVVGVDLPRNNLDGVLPLEIGILTALTTLRLNNNKLGDAPTGGGGGGGPGMNRRLVGLDPVSFPSTIGLLSSLRNLNLSECRMDGPLPSELGFLTNLITLNARKNGFNGEIPSELGRMTSIKTFRVASSRLEGPLPPELEDWTELVEFDVTSNELNGVIPPSFSENWRDARDIRFGRNMFQGSLDGSFCSGSSFALPNLSTLEADCARLACPCCSSCT